MSSKLRWVTSSSACHCNTFDHDKRQRPVKKQNQLVSLPPPESSETCAISADGSGDFPQKHEMPPNAVLILNDTELGYYGAGG